VLTRVLSAAQLRAPIFELSGADGDRSQAGIASLRASARSLLALISYVARHPAKLEH
jgi:hypothetical protein